MKHTQRPVRTELVELPVHPELVEVPGRTEAMFPIVLSLSREVTRVSIRSFGRLSPNGVGGWCESRKHQQGSRDGLHRRQTPHHLRHDVNLHGAEEQRFFLLLGQGCALDIAQVAFE